MGFGFVFAGFCVKEFFEAFFCDVFASFAACVGFHAVFYVVCDAGVEGAVAAFEDVDRPRLFFHFLIIGLGFKGLCTWNDFRFAD